MHRVTLVLKTSDAKSRMLFEAVDPTSAPAEETADANIEGPITVQCAAHSSCGAYLPVEVAEVEVRRAGVASKESSEVAAGDSASLTALTVRVMGGIMIHGCQPVLHMTVHRLGKVCMPINSQPDALIALPLQLDVDLSQAPHGGVVQLELWSGRVVLLTAPLLVLPPLAQHDGSDLLLRELQQHIQHCGWEAPPDSDSDGIAAWLADLGQVLQTVGCIDKVAGQSGSGFDVNRASTSVSSDAPGSWGGVTSTLARLHTSDPALLSTTLAIANNLLHHAQGASLPATATLLTSCVAQVQQQLEEVKNMVSATAASPSNAQGTLNDVRSTAYVALPSAAGPSALELSMSKDGLRHRSVKASVATPVPGEGASVAATESPTALKNAMKDAAASSSTHKGFSPPTKPNAASPSPQVQQEPSLMQCIKSAVTGFQSPAGLERQYAVWTAAYMNRVVFTHGFLLVLWTVASILRTALDGTLVSYLPLHLICGLPYVATTLLAMNQQHKWQEWVLCLHSVGRSIATAAAAAGGSQAARYTCGGVYTASLWHVRNQSFHDV
jgi:hypothetical protein